MTVLMIFGMRDWWLTTTALADYARLTSILQLENMGRVRLAVYAAWLRA